MLKRTDIAFLLLAIAALLVGCQSRQTLIDRGVYAYISSVEVEPPTSLPQVKVEGTWIHRLYQDIVVLADKHRNQ